MSLFQFHKLNEQGQLKAKAIQGVFEEALFKLDNIVTYSREYAICRTKLEEACFYAKKAMAIQPENQDEQDPSKP